MDNLSLQIIGAFYYWAIAGFKSSINDYLNEEDKSSNRITGLIVVSFCCLAFRSFRYAKINQ